MLRTQRGPYNVNSHGEARRFGRSHLYMAWQNMKARCRIKEDPSHKNYEAYKHVTLCEAWQTYEPFKRWSLASGYAPALWLDRKSNSRGYSPSNCRWVTLTESVRNRPWTPKRQKQIDAARAKQLVPVIRSTDGKRFRSLHDAARICKTNPSNIRRAIATSGTAGGAQWSY